MGKCKLFCVFLKVAQSVVLMVVLGGHILKLSDKVTITRAFLFWPVIVFFHRVSPIQFFFKIEFLKNTSVRVRVVLFFLKIVF